ncbi:MAG: TonB-dependent receptor [Desulfovermiculus sp.]|nr:TonB-dependent receptor [Desulfovermiculus sp.]
MRSPHLTLSIILLAMLLMVLEQDPAAGQEHVQDMGKDGDGTMLLFMGEDIELLSIASRREEAASQAPAVTEVVTREEFMNQGAFTLSHILERSPGFYMAEKEWGSQPYLRGIPNSVLFLYDTVPLGSEMSKSLHPIDHELSLAVVKQVEIVRGPASVLWGPDAYAGVVNVQPLSGQDLQGVDSGLMYASDRELSGAYLNAGHDAGAWDGFFSLTAKQAVMDDRRANVVSFFDYDGEKPVPPEDRYGSQRPGDAHYLDIYGRLNLGSTLSLSGRFSDSRIPYTLSSHDDQERWEERRDLPLGYLKLDANHDLDINTAIRFSGYYSQMDLEHRVIDKELSQNEETYFAEVLMDRSLFSSQGLLTTGLSYKHKAIDDAPIWDGYIPGFLGPDNVDFLPLVSLSDVNNELWSVFAQYRHTIGDIDLMLGLRQDFHQEYENSLSHSAALVWSPEPDWAVKLLYGTSYRTPFARQLLEESKPDMEKSENYSLQISWRPRKELSLTGTGFFNRISDHVMDDPYAGLSQPNEQDIYGLELEATYSPWDWIDLQANLTLMDHSGPDESHMYEEYSYIRPDGTEEHVFTELSYPYDPGAETMLNLGATFKPCKKLDLFTGLRYFSSRELIYPRGDVRKKVPSQWLADVSATYKDLGFPGLDLTLSVRNLFDEDYQTPGTYSMIEGEPFNARIMLGIGFSVRAVRGVVLGGRNQPGLVIYSQQALGCMAGQNDLLTHILVAGKGQGSVPRIYPHGI